MINLIACIYFTNDKFGIGKEGGLLFSIKNDLKYFKTITEHNIVVMGRRTWFSIPKEQRPLKNRLNIVITTTPNKYKGGDNVKFMTLEKFERKYNKIYYNQNVFIIGGGELYNTFMNHSFLKPKNLYLTDVKMKTNEKIEPDCFMDIPSNEYKLISVSQLYESHDKKWRYLKYTKYPSSNQEHQYTDILRDILFNGEDKEDRTNTGTKSVFCRQMRFNINHTVPLLTTKRVAWKSCIEELLWFLRGDTNAKILQKKGIKIWDGNTSREFLDKRNLSYEEGVLGPCFRGDELVQTDKGYKQINNIKTGDYVYSHTGKMKQVEQVMKSMYKGSMLVINGIKTTPEHPFYVREYTSTLGFFKKFNEPEWVEARKIHDKHLLGIKIETEVCVPVVIKNAKTMKIIGELVSHFIKSKNTLNIDLLDISDNIKMDKLIKEFKWNYFPKWVYKLPKEYIKQFLIGFNRKNIKKETELCLNLLEYKYGGKNVKYRENGYVWIKVENIESYPANEVVYNLSVNEDNTYTVSNVCVHNCYGWQWRFWGAEYNQKFSDTSLVNRNRIGGIDQITNIIKEIKTNPNSRRLLVVNWNVSDLHKMTLPPCHFSFQFIVRSNKYLDCHFTMRSNDMFLGNPFNLFSYTVLTYIIAKKCDLEPGELIYTGGDIHIYNNHIVQVKQQLERTPRALPVLLVSDCVKNKELEDITINDFDVCGYFPHSSIKAPMAV